MISRHKNGARRCHASPNAAVDFRISDCNPAGIAARNSVSRPPDGIPPTEIAERFGRDTGLTLGLGKFFGAQIPADAPNSGQAVSDALVGSFRSLPRPPPFAQGVLNE